MDVQNACREVISEVDGSLGCIVIDMQTGLTVASECRQGAALNDAMIGLVSVISTNMFCGRMIRRFEELLDRSGPSAEGFVREVQMTTAQTNQFMSAIPGWQNGLLVLITNKSVSLGLGWMAVHRIVDRLRTLPSAAAQAAEAPPPRPAPELGAPTSAKVLPEAGPTPAAPLPQAPFAEQLRGQPSAPASPLAVEEGRPQQAPDAGYRFNRPPGEEAPLAAPPPGNAAATAPEQPVPGTAYAAEGPPMLGRTPEDPAAQAQAARALAEEVLAATRRKAELEEAPPAAEANKAKTPAGARMNMFASRKRKRGRK